MVAFQQLKFLLTVNNVSAALTGMPIGELTNLENGIELLYNYATCGKNAKANKIAKNAAIPPVASLTACLSYDNIKAKCLDTLQFQPLQAKHGLINEINALTQHIQAMLNQRLQNVSWKISKDILSCDGMNLTAVEVGLIIERLGANVRSLVLHANNSVLIVWIQLIGLAAAGLKELTIIFPKTPNEYDAYSSRLSSETTVVFASLVALRIENCKDSLAWVCNACPQLQLLSVSNCRIDDITNYPPHMAKLQVEKWPESINRNFEMERTRFILTKLGKRNQIWVGEDDEMIVRYYDFKSYDELLVNFGGKSVYYNRKQNVFASGIFDWLLIAISGMTKINQLLIDGKDNAISDQDIDTLLVYVTEIRFLNVYTSDRICYDTMVEQYFLETKVTNFELSLWDEEVPIESIHVNRKKNFVKTNFYSIKSIPKATTHFWLDIPDHLSEKEYATIIPLLNMYTKSLNFFKICTEQLFLIEHVIFGMPQLKYYQIVNDDIQILRVVDMQTTEIILIETVGPVEDYVKRIDTTDAIYHFDIRCPLSTHIAEILLAKIMQLKNIRNLRFTGKNIAPVLRILCDGSNYSLRPLSELKQLTLIQFVSIGKLECFPNFASLFASLRAVILGFAPKEFVLDEDVDKVQSILGNAWHQHPKSVANRIKSTYVLSTGAITRSEEIELGGFIERPYVLQNAFDNIVDSMVIAMDLPNEFEDN